MTENSETQAREELEALQEKYMRAVADMDNLRKRNAARLEQAVMKERQDILGAFLEAVDSLDRALKAHEGEDNDWVRGTRAILKQMLEILGRFDVKPFSSRGKPFDPNWHEAVSRMADPNVPENTVLEVLQIGYRFKDGPVLRPARVVVSCQSQG